MDKEFGSIVSWRSYIFRLFCHLCLPSGGVKGSGLPGINERHAAMVLPSTICKGANDPLTFGYQSKDGLDLEFCVTKFLAGHLAGHLKMREEGHCESNASVPSKNAQMSFGLQTFLRTDLWAPPRKVHTKLAATGLNCCVSTMATLAVAVCLEDPQ